MLTVFYTFFFAINSFSKKIFMSNQLDFESKFTTNNSWKFEVAKVTESFPIFLRFFEVTPKYEHFLANT